MTTQISCATSKGATTTGGGAGGGGQPEAEGVVEAVMLQHPALVEAEDEPQAEAEDVGAAAVETVEGTRGPWPVDMPEPKFVTLTLINSP